MPSRTFIIGMVITVLLALNLLYQLSSNIRPELIKTNMTLKVRKQSDFKAQFAHRLNKYGPSKIVNPHNFKYISNPFQICSDKTDIELVICVPVARGNFEGRRVITETWGSFAYHESNKAILLFFIGNGTALESPEIDHRIQNESSVYNDIVQEDYIDSYKNLSLKSMSILKWVSTFCPNAKFVLKADDDMYVNIPYLMPILRRTKKRESKFILGSVIEGARPILDRGSKWYTSKLDFPGKFYPTYTSGTSYAMSGSTAELLYFASLETPLFWLEDIYITGLCAKKAGIRNINNWTQTYSKPKPRGCVFKKMVSGHRYNIEQIIKIHQELYDPNLKC